MLESRLLLTTVPQLSSLPGADQVLYLDFDGHVVRNTDWNSVYNERRAIHARPYDTNGNANTFSSAEQKVIEEVWKRVAEDFLPFDINVTTISPSDSALLGRKIAQRVLITTNVDDADMGGTGSTWFNDVGGVAFVSTWPRRGDTPAWVFANKIPKSAKGIAEAVSHELGHTLGLSHFGANTDPYYEGHGTGSTAWAPIMGTSYGPAMSQWSDGSYPYANRTQNDIATISSLYNSINIRDDDHGDSSAAATNLPWIGNSLEVSGIIERRSDVDVFEIVHPGGRLKVDAMQAAFGGNLDIALELQTASGQVVHIASPDNDPNASLDLSLSADSYYLQIEGVGKPATANDPGYSDYGSLGYYSLQGTSFPIAAAPVQSTKVKFSSSLWQSSFRSQLDNNSLEANVGWDLSNGTSSPMPWNNIDEIHVYVDGPAGPSTIDDFRIETQGDSYSPTIDSIEYHEDATAGVFRITLGLAGALPSNRYRLVSERFDTNQEFSVLHGAASTEDQSVSSTDLLALAASYNSSSADEEYSPYSDFNGDGYVSSSDLLILAANYLTSLQT